MSRAARANLHYYRDAVFGEDARSKLRATVRLSLVAAHCKVSHLEGSQNGKGCTENLSRTWRQQECDLLVSISIGAFPRLG